MTRPRSRSYAILRKELIEVWRDPRTLALTLAMPVLMLVLYGYGVSTEIRNIPMVVLDQDRSSQSRDFIGDFIDSRFFLLSGYVSSYTGFDNAIDSGRARIGLIVPPDFRRKVTAGQLAEVFVAIDGSEPNTATVAAAYVSTIVSEYSGRIVARKLRGTGILRALNPVDLEPRIWYNPELRSVYFIVPGLVAIILMMTSALLTSGTIAREWELGTMEPLIASPLKAYELMLGKIAAYTIISFADIALVVVAGAVLFQVPLRGSIPLLAIMSAVFLLSSLGLGLLISTRSASVQSATLLAFLTTMIPGMLLSGFIFPISSMPRFVQVLTYAIPARYFLVIVRGIFLKGTGISELWPQALPMTVLGAVLFAMSIRSFRKQMG